MDAVEVKERPILFSAPMVRAILAGKKTQTRRVVKPQPPSDATEVFAWFAPHLPDEVKAPEGVWYYVKAGLRHHITCPYGKPGDRLLLLSSWGVAKRYDTTKPSNLPKSVKVWTYFDGEKPSWVGKGRPGRFMPKWMRSRMPRREITDLRIERVQEITEVDAIDEGMTALDHETIDALFPDYKLAFERWIALDPKGKPPLGPSPRMRFEALWQKLNVVDSWKANPWVWVITFKPVPASSCV